MKPKSHGRDSIAIRKRIKEQLSRCRDRGIRTKAELILLALKLGNVTEACQRRGFSTKFYYKWFGRIKKAKFDIVALREHSRRPKHSPKKTSRQLELRIHYLRLKHGYGSRMLEAILRQSGTPLCRSAICWILNGRKKITKSRREKLKSHRRRYELDVPGLRIQLDVKYVPHPVGGNTIFNYVAIDECTRLRFARAYTALNDHSTADFLKHLLEFMPFPIATIQTDNGPEFTFKLLCPEGGREHRMQTFCKAYGIRHRLIPPGEKELNGKVERSHRIDEQYFYWRAPTDTIENFNKALAQWLKQYNSKRIHGGIGFMTPQAKLEERCLALLKTQMVGHEEAVRLRFIESLPMEALPQDMQLQRLEALLRKFNNAA